MGFYSYKCAKSKISIPSVHAGLHTEASKVVIVKPDNTTITGIYDGYGNIVLENGEMDDYLRATLSLAEKKFPKENSEKSHYKLFRMVRADVYNGETFDQLNANTRCPEQGFFYEPKSVRKIMLSLMKYELMYK